MLADSKPACFADSRGACVTIGNFDGVHAGHRRLIAQTREIAARNDLAPVVVTFWPHPGAVLAPEKSIPLLTEHEERRRQLELAGVDRLLELEFNAALAVSSAMEFARDWLLPMNARHLVIGYDFRMGHNPASQDLGKMAEELGLVLTRIPPLARNGAPVSSTRIRELLKNGAVEEAAILLGRPYSIRGIVEHGFGRGRELGFPTANIGKVKSYVPGDGVYATWNNIGGRFLPAVTNIGANPTFAGRLRTIETFLLEPPGDLYGDELELHFVARLRGERTFPSPAALADQIALDTNRARALLNEPPYAKS